jgi:two-component system NarL family response regulator
MEAARHIHDLAPQTRLLLYTGNAGPELTDKALRMGARGLILKDAPLDELARAVQIVGAGGTYIDPSLAGETSAQPSSSEPTLTPRELAVLHLLAQGHTNDQAGAELSISPDTVQTHVRNAMKKLGADTRTQAVATALREALIA